MYSSVNSYKEVLKVLPESLTLHIRWIKNPYFVGAIILVNNGTILQIKLVANIKD